MEIPWGLLERYIAGECAPEERQRFEAWLAESAVHRQVLHEFREVAAQSRLVVTPEREERILAELKRKLPFAMAPRSGTSVPLRLSRSQSSVSPARWRTGVKAAAVAALLAGSAAAYLMYSTAQGSANVAARIARHVVKTPRGQRAAFNLPDGSRVILNAGSTLEYPLAFGASREVRLEGEAYFEVEHDASRPFMVRAGDIVATDLGTEFVIRAYPEDGGSRVVVRQGKVGLRAARATDSSRERDILPGQVGWLDSHGKPLVGPVALDPSFAWTEGRLVFNGTPLSEVAIELGRWYDVQFQFPDSAVASYDLYGSFRNQSLANVLSQIAPTLQVQFERRGNVVIVRPAAAAR